MDAIWLYIFVLHLQFLLYAVTIILQLVFCRMSCVSHSWKKVICDDKVSRDRRLHYIQLCAVNKVMSYRLYTKQIFGAHCLCQYCVAACL